MQASSPVFILASRLPAGALLEVCHEDVAANMITVSLPAVPDHTDPQSSPDARCCSWLVLLSPHANISLHLPTYIAHAVLLAHSC